MAVQDEKSTPGTRKYVYLFISVVFDLIGMASFLLPGLGEIADLAWAPIAGLVSFFMYGGLTGATGGLLTFAEEILPGTDWIPSMTLTWCYKYLVANHSTKVSIQKG